MSHSIFPKKPLFELTSLSANQDEATLLPFHFISSEGLSEDFEYSIDAISTQLESLQKVWLDKLVTFSINLPQQAPRIINGIVTQFQNGQIEEHPNPDYQNNSWLNKTIQKRIYHITLRPAFSLFALSQHSRIFQDLTVIEILQKIMQEKINEGGTGFHIQYHQLGASYLKLSYCVQFAETDKRFIERILSEAGIYYAYEHTDRYHSLVLYDAYSPLPASLNSFFYSKESKIENPHFYEWAVKHSADLRLSYSVKAKSNLVALNLNSIFKIQVDKANAFTEKNRAENYRVIRFEQEGFDSTIKNMPNLSESYQHSSLLIKQHPCFTPHVIPKFLMKGPQVARVIGPKNKPIYTNKGGAVKIHFPWDTKGPQNENSSCWVPVIQSLSGKQSGSQFIPRIGDQVIVDFIEGDIDRPIIIGSTYDEEHPPIFSADKCNTALSGYQTRLIDKQGKSSLGHQLQFNESKEQEGIDLHSQGDMNWSTLNDLIQDTRGSEEITVNTEMLINSLKGSGSLHAKRIEINAGKSQLIMDADRIHLLPAAKLILKAKGAEGGAQVIRQGDQHQCGDLNHGKTSIVSGSSVVKEQGLPIVCVGDKTACGASFTKGISSITIEGKPIVTLTSEDDHSGKSLQSSKVTGVDGRSE